MCLFRLHTSTPHVLTAVADTHTEHSQLSHAHVNSHTCSSTVLCYTVLPLYSRWLSSTGGLYYLCILPKLSNTSGQMTKIVFHNSILQSSRFMYNKKGRPFVLLDTAITTITTTTTTSITTSAMTSTTTTTTTNETKAQLLLLLLLLPPPLPLMLLFSKPLLILVLLLLLLLLLVS